MPGSSGFWYLTGGFLLGSAATFFLVTSQERRSKDPSEFFFARRRRRLQGEHQQSHGGDESAPGDEESPSQTNSTSPAPATSHQDFLTGIVSQLWPFMSPAGSAAIRESLEPMLKEYKMQLLKVDLGSSPLHIDNVVVHELRDSNNKNTSTDTEALAPPNKLVQFDFDVIWDAVDCEIQMKADFLGKFGISSMQMAGRMSILLKPLTGVLPCIEAVQYGFLNQPHFQLGFSGVAKMADLGVVDKTVRKTIHDSLASMVVLPYRMTYKMDPKCSIYSIYEPPQGVVRIWLESGRGFEIQRRTIGKDDIPDVYCLVKLGNSSSIRSPTIPDNLEPEWSHEKQGKQKKGFPMDFVVYDFDQCLTIDVRDEDDGPLDTDDDLGFCQVTIREMLLATERRKEMELCSLDDDSETGAFITFRCDMLPFTADVASFSAPMITSTPPTGNRNREGKDSDSDPNKQIIVGMLTILIKEASDVPIADKTKAATFVKVTSSSTKDEFVTSTIRDYPGYSDGLNPVYDGIFNITLYQGQTPPDLTLTLIDAGGEENRVLGTTTVTHSSLVAAAGKTLEERRFLSSSGDEGAEALECALDFSISIRGIEVPVEKESSAEAPQSLEAISTNLRSTVSSRDIAKTSLSLRSVTKRKARKMASKATSAPVIPEKPKMGEVRITVVKGKGFRIRKRRFKKDDIPDVYCKIMFGKAPIWTTSVIPDNVSPEWNESKRFVLYDYKDLVTIDVYDRNSGKFDKDDLYGRATETVGKLLLSGGSTDVEVKEKTGKGTGLYITLTCSLVE